MLCRKHDDLLLPTRFLACGPQVTVPTNQQADNTQPCDPTTTLSAPRSDVPLNPEQSALPATVQVGKMSPQRSQQRPPLCSTPRNAVAVHSASLLEKGKTCEKELRHCHRFCTKDSDSASEQMQILISFKCEKSQSPCFVWLHPAAPLPHLLTSDTTSWTIQVAIVIICRLLFSFKERNTTDAEEEKYCTERTKQTVKKVLNTALTKEE